MKKWFLLASLIPGFVLADQVVSTSFKGLNSNENPAIIDPSEAQDLLNVDTTPGGKSVKKRSGFGVYRSLGTGQSVRGGHHAFDAFGNNYQLWGSSKSLYSIMSDAVPVQIISSATLNSSWDCADTQANSYCVNSNRDLYLKTNGTTLTWYPSPLGTMIETTPDRVVVAGVSGSPSTLYISQSNTFTNFVTGVNPTDAFTEVIAAPGSQLTHIRWGCGKLLWWKDVSFGYFDFDDQYTAQVSIVSDSIGTFDNTSAIDPGGQVWFRGQDGHTWKYDCSSLAKESIDITPNIQAAGNRVTNSWTQTTASDFNSGSVVNLDTTTVSGTVSLPGYYDFFNLANWTAIQGTWGMSSGYPVVVSTAGPGVVRGSIRGPRINQFPGTSEWYATTGIGITAGAGNMIGCVGIVNSSTQGYHVCAQYDDAGSSLIYLANADFSATYGSTSLGVIDSYRHIMTLKYNTLTGLMSAYWDDVLKITATDTAYTNMIYPSLWGNLGGANKFAFGPVGIRTSSGTLFSPVHNAPSIISWSTMELNNQLNEGSQSFYLRASTNSFTTLSSTPSWTSQDAGALITISSGTYFQFASTFTVTVGTQNPTLSNFTINWLEGSAIDQAYMLYFDNAIWESVAFGVGQSTNNYVFKKDLINDGWTLYNFGAGGMLVQSNRLYFGGTTSDDIFKYGTSNSDNGSSINAFWRSKAFTGPDPFLQSQLTNIDVFAKKDQGSTLTSTYSIDATTSTTYSVSLSTGGSHAQNRKLLPSGKMGYSWDLQLGETSDSSTWELLGYRIGFVQLPYRVTTP